VLSATRYALLDSRDEFHTSAGYPSGYELEATLWSALELSELQQTPELETLFATTLTHPGLLWHWGDRVRERFPVLAQAAVTAMSEFVLDSTFTDRSRRNTVLGALLNSSDDALVVPELLKFLQHLLLLRWEGARIVDNLRSRGQGQAALDVLHAQLRPGEEDKNDLNARLFEVAMRVDPEAVYRWLDAMYRAGPSPEADAHRLEQVWHQSGVAVVVRSWFDHVKADDRGREFLRVATTNPRDTAFCDFARHALYGSVFDPPGSSDDDEDDDAGAPQTVADLERALAEASDTHDVGKLVGRLVERGELAVALRHAHAWLAPFIPPTKTDAAELAQRLLALSQNDVWLPEWTAVLASAIRLVDGGQRDALIAELERRS
jgi:hypothetical protein